MNKYIKELAEQLKDKSNEDFKDVKKKMETLLKYQKELDK